MSSVDLEIRSQVFPPPSFLRPFPFLTPLFAQISTHYEDFFGQLEIIQELDSMSTIVGESVEDLDHSVKKFFSSRSSSSSSRPFFRL